MGERLGFQKAALTEEEVLVQWFCVIKTRQTNGPHGLCHECQWFEFRLFWNFSAESVTFHPSLEFLCDVGFTFTMTLSFFAHRMYQLGVV